MSDWQKHSASPGILDDWQLEESPALMVERGRFLDQAVVCVVKTHRLLSGRFGASDVGVPLQGSPMLIYVANSICPGNAFDLDGPSVRHCRELGPQRVFAQIISKNREDAVFVIEWIRHCPPF